MLTVISGNNLEVMNENHQKPIELKVFPAKQPYIPYALAVSYINQNGHDRKIKTLKRIFEAYHDQIVQKNKHWQCTVEALRNRNDELVEENKYLLHQATQTSEKWERERTWLLEMFTQKMNYLQKHCALTTQDLQERVVDLEDVQEQLSLSQSHPETMASLA